MVIYRCSLRCLLCHTKVSWSSEFLLDFSALFPACQWWDHVMSFKEIWLYILPYRFSPTAFDRHGQRPWLALPTPNQLRPTEKIVPKVPAEKSLQDPRCTRPHSVWVGPEDNVDLQWMRSPCLGEFTLQKGLEKWSNWTSGVSERWGNSTARRIWQEIYELARQHRTEIRLRNGNTLPWAGYLWTRSSLRHRLASLPVLTSASLRRPLALIFRLRN